MKKLLGALFLVAVILCAGMYTSQTVFGIGSGCIGSEASIFPYNFLCSRNNADTDNMDIGTTVAGGTYAVPGSFSPRNSLDFTAGFDSNAASKNSAGTGARVLVWIYAQGFGDDFGSPVVNVTPTSSVDGVAGTGDYCPGDSPYASHGKVYNYNTVGPDQSPAAFPVGTDGQGIGVENCHAKGYMASWLLPAVGANAASHAGKFKFRVDLDPSSGARFCVRETVSIQYPDDNGLWPPVGAGQYDSQNYTANHVAKQSEVRCYQANNTEPTGSMTICQSGTQNADGTYNYNIKGNDPDHDGQAVNFAIVHSGEESNPLVSGTTSSSGSSGRAAFIVGRTYSLRIFDRDTGQPKQFSTARFGGCSGGPPPPVKTIGCDYYQQSLAPHTINKFTSFPQIAWYVTAVPGAGPVASPTGWASINPGADYESGVPGSSTVSGADINSNQALYYDGRGGAYLSSTGNFLLGFPPPSGHDRFVFVQTWTHHLSSNTWTYATGSVSYGNCFSANCTLSFDGTVPNTGDGVYAGQTFWVHALISNAGHGDLQTSAGGAPFQLTGAGDFMSGQPLVSVSSMLSGDHGGSDPEGQEEYSFQLTAPAGVGTYNLGGYPDYNGRFVLGNICSAAAVNVYQHFSITPHTVVTNIDDDENPASVQYTAGGTKTAGPDVAVTDQVWVTRNNVDQGRTTYGKVYGAPPDDSFSQPVAARIAGDTYCSHITIAPASGDVGPNGVVNGASATADSPQCLIIKNRPYFKVYGGDISVGNGLGVSCPLTSDASILGWGRQESGAYYGAGSQFAAFVHGQTGTLIGFGSAQGSSSTGPNFAQAPRGLSFANIPVEAANNGGKLNNPGCINTLTAPSGAGTWRTINGANSAASPTNRAPISSITGPLTLSGGTLATGTDATMYVDGDVYINGNILAAGGAASIIDIPNFTLVASGNIFIDKSVSQLYGNFIAQPKGGSGGSIYTCTGGANDGYSNGSEYVSQGHFADCNNRLTITGSFTAKKVYLLRTSGSQYLDTGGTVQNGSGSANAAEIFQYNPLSWIRQSPTGDASGGSSFKYDAITTLPPVL